MTVRAEDKCFACGRKLGKNPAIVTTKESYLDSDGIRKQYHLFVGRECYKQIKAASYPGWQPPTGGPRLYLINEILHDESEGEVQS